MKKKEKTPVDVICADPEQGLSLAQAQQRMDAGWDNRTTDADSTTWLEILGKNVLTYFNLVFALLGVCLFVAGSGWIKYGFLVVVVVNIIIGCFQQIRAKRAVDKLTLLTDQKVPVVRQGQVQTISSRSLVRDDIAEFSTGMQICADGILRTGKLYVNQALITGEAEPVEMFPGDTLRSGSVVVAGSGRVQLTAVGDDGYAAVLAAKARKNPQVTKSEMMASLDKLIRVIGILLIPVGLGLFCQEYFLLQLGFRESVEATVAALVGMIPEGLYLLTSVALAVAALQLARQKVLVRDLQCVETLARVDTLCVDKTGTITKKEMRLEELIPLADAPVEEILRAMFGAIVPDNPTAQALQDAFSGKSAWTRQREYPFTSEKKWSGVTFANRGTFLVGAPEILLEGGFPEHRKQAAAHAAAGYRVLLLCGFDGIPEQKPETDKLTPLAFLLLSNQLRDGVEETFSYFAAQGVTVKVISGDDPVTASQVALRAGILGAERYIDVTKLETKEDFQKAAEGYTVFGRVTPEKKQSLIAALKDMGHTVAMTGDGVNDLLAMKEADCSIAMAAGAPAAGRVGRLVLLNNDFSSMPGIVAQGRRVIHNIQRAAALFLVKNIFSLGMVLVSFLTGFAYPLEPQHMSIISGLTIGVPSFFLALEPNDQPLQGAFLPTVLRRALPGGLTDIVCVLSAQWYMTALGLPQEQISTVCTAVLALVGLTVLFHVSVPMGIFRGIVWGAMAVAIVGCFTLLGGIFNLTVASLPVVLVILALGILTPTVYFIFVRLFALFDKGKK